MKATSREKMALRIILPVSIIVLITHFHMSSAYSPSWDRYKRSPAGVYVKYFGDAVTWPSAERRCSADGGQLAVVDTPQKLHFVQRKLNDDVWIGLKKSGGTWKWVNGVGLRGGNWMRGEPNGGDCVYALQYNQWIDQRDDGKWRDANCGMRRPFLCEAGNACVVRNPCVNGGKCVGNGRGTSCVCPVGFQGQNCEQDKRPCIAYNPCRNGAHCTNKGTDYSCTCPAGFQGKDCEQDRRPCIAYNPCRNGAHCTNKGRDYSCTCPAGFQGKDCEQDRRPCIAYNPCQNGAHCTNKGRDYSCTCPAGFQGKNCEQDKRPCFSYNPCQNGGSCHSVGSGYTCSCKAGFDGKQCEKNCHLESQGGLPKKLDLIFLVDGSVSVRQGPFLKGLEFINRIVDHVDISENNGRIGFIQFAHKLSKETDIQLEASVKMGKNALKDKIMHTHYMNGGTQIYLALNEALAMFAKEGRSKDVAKYIMILSDGQSSDTVNISAAMNKISAANIETFVIGVGEHSKLRESRRQLLEIARGNSNRIFEVDNYDQLNEQVLKEVLVSQCS